MNGDIDIGLARTDNSGWGEEFERLVSRLLAHASDEARADAGTRSGEKVT